MKKSLKFITAALVASALAFSLVSCSDDGDDGSSQSSQASQTAKVPESTGTNEFAGSTYKQVEEYSDSTYTKTTTHTFSTNTYDEIWERKYPATEHFIEYSQKGKRTYNYSYDSTLKLFYRSNSASSYVPSAYYNKDEKEIFRWKSGDPATFKEYKDKYLLLLRALTKPGVTATEEELFAEKFGEEIYWDFRDYGYTDETGTSDVSEEIYQKALAGWNKTTIPAEVLVRAYKIEGNTLKLYYIDGIPQGKKFGSIFNDYYGFRSSNKGDDNQTESFHIDVNYFTFNDTAIGIGICDADNNETNYKILSATDDSMTITPITKVIENEDEDDDYYNRITGIEYDKSKTITCPITYKTAENDNSYITAEVEINGKKYSFVIVYITSDDVENSIKAYDEWGNVDTYTKQ